MRAPILWIALFAGFVCAPAMQVRAQSNPHAGAMAQNGFFSGFVTELTGDSVTVSRKGANREEVRRTFHIDSQTKVEGKLRMSARVTVRFEPGPNGDHAVRIIVR